MRRGSASNDKGNTMNVIQKLEAEIDRIGLDAQTRIDGLRQAIDIMRGGCPPPAPTAEAPASEAETETPAPARAKPVHTTSCVARIAEAAQELAACGTQVFDQAPLLAKAKALHPEEADKLRRGIYHAVSQLITTKVLARVPGGFSLAKKPEAAS